MNKKTSTPTSLCFLDGATGTELIKRGMPAGVSPELWVLEHPEALCAIHQAYAAAGSQILLTPTFGANRCKLAEFGAAEKTREIAQQLAEIAVKNRPTECQIFGDISSTGRFVEPYGDLTFNDAVEIYKEQAEAMVQGGVGGLFIETMMDLQEARAAYLGAREAAPHLPIFVSMTFEKSGRTMTGVDPISALVTLQALGADAFGCNCSNGPEQIAEVIRTLHPYATIPLLAKPNAGLPKLENGKTVFPMAPEEFAAASQKLLEAGAAYLGGCCGTTPAHIQALTTALKEKSPLPLEQNPASLLSSPTRWTAIGDNAPFTLIGERINPTGKKSLQAELREGKTDLAISYGRQQQEAGARLLDVNVGMSGICEAEMMHKILCRLLKGDCLPLSIDSTDPQTVENALRLYPGRALLNSISLEKQRIEKILPIAAKYGARLILLPLTDQGIPSTTEARIQVVQKLLHETQKYGYSQQDILVDVLAMTVATDSLAAQRCLDLIRWCTQQGIGTVCGLSNISFGMANRPLLNRVFLGAAMGAGLTAAIANPLFPEILDEITASEALLGKDAGQRRYLTRFANSDTAATHTMNKTNTPEEGIVKGVYDGDSQEVTRNIQSLLDKNADPSSLLNQYLIPAILEVGKRYEKREYFLPQLIQSAEAMQAGTALLEEKMRQSGKQSVPRGRMIFATVKGDIHDIGKNIVIVMLRNCGIEVIDLGKDVPAEVILDCAQKENISIIALSALMTTTMEQIRATIELAKQRKMRGLHFLIGGAVVDQHYADEVGADYCSDPMTTLHAVEKLI